MSNLKRYRLTESDQGLGGIQTRMKEHRAGEWIKFDDAYQVSEWYKNRMSQLEKVLKNFVEIMSCENFSTTKVALMDLQKIASNMLEKE